MLYSVGGSTVLSSEATRGQNPEIYDYWDFYYEQEDYTGPDIDVETYVCDTLGVCRGHPGFHLYRGGFPGGEWCTPMDEIGMRSLAEQESLWTLGAGAFGHAYGSWLETLEELYFNEILHTVQLNSTVTDVDTSGDVVEVSAVVAKCSDCHEKPGPGLGAIPDDEIHARDTFTANAAISTLPLGVLKAGYVTFTPALLQRKLDAIDLLDVGNGGKLFLRFSSRFWDENITMFFTEGEADFCWSYKYKGGDGDSVLVCYVVGENAEVLDTVGNENQQIAHVLSDLDAMYPGTPFSDNFVEGYWKRMDDKRNSRGCYSFPKPGSYPTDGSPSAREILAEPVGSVLYFAGEATHNAWSATVVGAMDSGLRTAGEIDADHDPVVTPPAVPAIGRRGLLVLGLTLLGLLVLSLPLLRTGIAPLRRGRGVESKSG
jgi:hypothetical protein